MSQSIMKGLAPKGIVIAAVGHPYYGRFAYNLAVTVKAAEDLPIAVLYKGASLCHLSQDQLDIFDELIELPASAAENVSCKLYAAEYSPFENTLLLDADMLWLTRKPSELFDELAGVEFTAITEGNDKNPAKDYFFWADTGEIREVYGIAGDIYQWRTEVVYFSFAGRKVIKRALEIVQNPQLTTLKTFRKVVPDELGINVATAEAGIGPHQYRWKPSYWHLMNGNFFPSPAELNANYYLISFGSDSVSGTAKKVYDQVMKACCNKLERQHVFPMESKRLFLNVLDKM